MEVLFKKKDVVQMFKDAKELFASGELYDVNDVLEFWDNAIDEVVPAELKASEIIECFSNLLREAKPKSENAEDRIQYEHDLASDILHALEIEELTDDMRDDLIEMLVQSRTDRRLYKDEKAIMEPIANFSARNKKTFEDLKQLLGLIRKEEAYHNERHYNYKVLDLDALRGDRYAAEG